jgi:hypothetical protein
MAKKMYTWPIRKDTEVNTRNLGFKVRYLLLLIKETNTNMDVGRKVLDAKSNMLVNRHELHFSVFLYLIECCSYNGGEKRYKTSVENGYMDDQLSYLRYLKRYLISQLISKGVS